MLDYDRPVMESKFHELNVAQARDLEVVDALVVIRYNAAVFRDPFDVFEL